MVKEIDMSLLISLGIPNLRAIWEKGIIIGVRGETLSGAKNRRYMKAVRDAGIDTIIDLRAGDRSGSFESVCEKSGFQYFYLPVDPSYTPDEEIIRGLPQLIRIINQGGFYISCAQGLHRTDIALSLRYLFCPTAQEPPILYGHHRNGAFKCEDIFQRANSIYRYLTADNKESLGWDQKFDDEFAERKKLLTQTQNDYITASNHDDTNEQYFRASTESKYVVTNESLPIDIGGRDSEGPAARLSNFTERHFVLDGVECASLEGALQSFKFSEPEKQREVCALVGVKAKKAGKQTDWQPSQKLYWNGNAYPRDSAAYQELLDRLYGAVFDQDQRFVSDLYATGERKLTHSIGKSNPKETALTEKEFCDRLEKLRNRLTHYVQSGLE